MLRPLRATSPHFPNLQDLSLTIRIFGVIPGHSLGRGSYLSLVIQSVNSLPDPTWIPVNCVQESAQGRLRMLYTECVYEYIYIYIYIYIYMRVCVCVCVCVSRIWR